MRRTVVLLVLAVGVILLGGRVLGQEKAKRVISGLDFKSHEEFSNTVINAQKMERSGKPHEAFLIYAAIPNFQDWALELAKQHPEEYLDVLRNQGDSISRPFARLIEGDLLLATGKKDEALTAYRAAAASVATVPGKGWRDDQIPFEEYVGAPSKDGRTQPFQSGPGSQRDNWLLQRFLTLRATDDAAREFARIWEIHRKKAAALIEYDFVFPAQDRPARRMRHIRHAQGFGEYGPQFAVDYANFLKEQGKLEQALEVLREPLLAVNIDRSESGYYSFPGEFQLGGVALEYPVRYRSQTMNSGGGCYDPRKSRWEFIAQVRKVFQAAGKEDELVAMLQKNIDAGTNRLRRVLAHVRRLQGRPDEALRLELEYLDQAKLNPLSLAWRRGRVLEEAEQLADAAKEYETALERSGIPPTPASSEDTVLSEKDSGFTVYLGGYYPPTAAGIRAEHQAVLLGRLEEIYAALKQPEAFYKTALRQYQANAALFEERPLLARVKKQAVALGREKEFEEWLRARLRSAKSSDGLAVIYWVLGDYPACAKNVAECYKIQGDRKKRGREEGSLEDWQQTFFLHAKPHEATLTLAVAAVDSDTPRRILETLDLRDNLDGPDVIKSFEKVLAPGAEDAFAMGMAWHKTTCFHDNFDVARRLMRLYEKQGETQKLIALGLRVARCEKPFHNWKQLLPLRLEGDLWLVKYSTNLHACMALLIEKADAATLAQLAEEWKDIPDWEPKRLLKKKQAESAR